jgi:hypothetical protein
MTNEAKAKERVAREARIKERNAAGVRIDSLTAQVWWTYAQILDPYGDGGLTEEEDCVGRVWFAMDPIERIPVCHYDLPEATWQAIQERGNSINPTAALERLMEAVREGELQLPDDQDRRNELTRCFAVLHWHR